MKRPKYEWKVWFKDEWIGCYTSNNYWIIRFLLHPFTKIRLRAMSSPETEVRE